MLVYKFGGASIKDARAIENLLKIVESAENGDILIVVSAIGKTTRALEAITQQYIESSNNLIESTKSLFDFHRQICLDLFPGKTHEVFADINYIEKDLVAFLTMNKSPKKDFIYDQIVSVGELLSSKIIFHYLNHKFRSSKWIDARQIIKTDSYYRRANVNWKKTVINARENIPVKGINVTQGFIASDENNFSTTLGLEGSDYSAAIFAYCLNAESLTVWKDVEGILNADPRYFENTKPIRNLSFREAIELSYFGASVIHPKTIQPLQQKEIPLYVRSFVNNKAEGTVISKGVTMNPLMPCYIKKTDQILLSISSLDFSFIVEENMSEIFTLIAEEKLKLNMMQNSAISFTLVLEDKYSTFENLLNKLKSKYRLKYNTNVELYTVRHYTPESMTEFESNKTILLKQFSRETAQYVVK